MRCKKPSDPVVLRMLHGQIAACFGAKLDADTVAHQLLTHRSDHDSNGLLGRFKPTRHAKVVPLLVAAEHGCDLLLGLQA